MAKTLRQLLEAKYVSSADFVMSAGGRKVHKRKKIADDDYNKEDDLDNDGDNDADDKKLANEGAVPAHMQGKQKPYVSSDGKGNYEVLGNRGQTKAEFSRKEHGKDAQSKAQAHLKSKYDEYMKEETQEQFKVGDFVKDHTGKIHRVFGVNGTNLETGIHYGKNKYGGTNNLHISKAKKVPKPQDVKEETELEQLDDVTYYDGSDMLGEAQARYSQSYKFTHKPGDEESERKLADLKASVKGTGKRVVLQGRLGKNNPNAHKYSKNAPHGTYANGKRTNSDVSGKSGAHTHQRIQKADAAHHDVYVYDRRESVDYTLDEGVNKSDIPAYLRKKTGDQLTTKDLDKERTQNRSHPETIKKINGTDMKEQAPVAPSIGVHRIGVTVSDPDHPAVTKRKELIQKFVRVTAHDKDRAMEIGKKHFAKKGWKVHDANHSGMVHEEAINEYSMDDVRKDAADRLKKSIDKQSDDRIAALKNPPKKKGFFARVGEKQINMVKGAYHGLTKEEVELEEAKDQTDKRFDLLARLGLVEKDELANLRLAMKTLSEDKQLSIKQRDLLLNVYESLISLVTGDDTLFSRMKIKVQEETLDEMKDDPCWKDYQMVGTKKKNGKTVPNCVPKEEVENVPFDGPYTKTPDNVKDKSGAEHKPQSRARHLARLAMKQMAKKSDKA
jgi:hypothetical protein